MSPNSQCHTCNKICMTMEGCTFIHSISIDDVKLAVKKLN